MTTCAVNVNFSRNYQLATGSIVAALLRDSGQIAHASDSRLFRSAGYNMSRVLSGTSKNRQAQA